MLNFNEFYLFNIIDSRKDYVKFQENNVNRVSWDFCHQLHNGTYKPEKPMIFTQKGRITCDVMSTDLAFVKLFSDRLINILKQNHISGFETFKSPIITNRGNIREDFQGFSITGTSGKILKSMVERKTLPPIVPEGYPYEAYVGLYFDPITWSGDDIFLLGGTAMIVVTEKVKMLMERNNVKNIQFIKLPEAEISIIALDSHP